jgi:hypothetical protein
MYVILMSFSILHHSNNIWLELQVMKGACDSIVAEALCYKPEVRGIVSNLPNPSGRTMALGSTQPLTEMSTRNLKK